MARLIYSAIASADGHVEDAAGSFGWAAPGVLGDVVTLGEYDAGCFGEPVRLAAGEQAERGGPLEHPALGAWLPAAGGGTQG